MKFFAGNSCRYPVVREAVAKIGWKIVEENASEKTKSSCNFIWVDVSNVVKDCFSTIQPWQRINHFPGMVNIARKSRLAEHLDSMKKRFKKDYSFYPTTFILPRDKHHMKECFDSNGNSKTTYIVKPDGGSRGIGIFLTKKWDVIDELSSTHVAQRYISDPLLIEKKKFDLRIYVLVTSCDPLRIYLFQDGLVRFCTQDFVKPNKNNLNNTCMHLSNYSINKRSDDFSGSEDITGSSGSKRSIKWFLSWLTDEKGKHVAEKLWSKIGHICVKTILCIEPILVREYKTTFALNSRSGEKNVKENQNGEVSATDSNKKEPKSFDPSHSSSNDENFKSEEGTQKNAKMEKNILISGSRSLAILGFDVMIDSKLKPHLIEVNHLPSFATDSVLDESIKSRVVLQALSSVQAAASDQKSYEMHAKQLLQNRLFNSTSHNHDGKQKTGERRKSTDINIVPIIQNNNKVTASTSVEKRVGIEEFVTEIYSIHAPEKMDKIHLLLQKYQGHEDWLMKKLKEKYSLNSDIHSEDQNEQFAAHDARKKSTTTVSHGHSIDDDEITEEEFCDNDSDEEDRNRSHNDQQEELFDQNMIYEDDILVTNGDYERIYPPKRGKYKPPSYEKMRKHAAEEDYKQQMRLVCPLWQLRKYERQDENVIIPATVEVKRELLINNKSEGYYSRADWLVHGNVHKKCEPIPTKNIPLPSQKQLEAAERLSRGFSVEKSVLISEEEASSQVDGNEFVTRLSLAEQAGKEIRRKNEEKFIPRSQLNINPINIAFGSLSSQPNVDHYSSGERCYVDFTGRKIGYR